jgi:hypothetical protein
MNFLASMLPRAINAARALNSTGSVSRRSFLQAGFAAGALGLASTSLGAEFSGESSHSAQQDAMRHVPISKLNEEAQRKVMSVLERPSIYRRLPQQTIDCDPDLFVHLIRNPEVIVNIWEVMQISQMTAERTGAFSWKGNDGQGTQSNVELVYGTDELHLVYGEGFYEGPLLKRKVAGRCVVLLRSGYGLGQDSRAQVSNKLDVFIAIDNVGAELIAKTLQPLVGSTADSNFTEAANFISKLSNTAEKSPEGMPRLAAKLHRCDDTVKREFTAISSTVNRRVAERLAGNIRR